MDVVSHFRLPTLFVPSQFFATDFSNLPHVLSTTSGKNEA